MPDRELSGPLEVIPGVGVPPVRLGMTHAEVIDALGEPDRKIATVSQPDSWSYHGLGIKLTFDKGRVTHIDVGVRPAAFDVRYKGISVVHNTAVDFVRLISGDHSVTEEDLEDRYVDSDLGVAVWRPMAPTWSEPSEQDDEDRFWHAIGVGDV